MAANFPWLVDKINDWTGRVVRYIVLAIVGACVVEVVARYFFDSPTIWAYEFEQLTCAILYILIGGYVLFQKGHVRVEVIYVKLSPKTQSYIDLFLSYPLMFIMSMGLTYFGSLHAFDSIRIWEHTYTSWAPPIWPVKLMIPIGSILLALQVISDFIRRISSIRKKN
jgi:TRAP-type mannitol/chloroaromatic compound transport system permease small subunit